MKKIILSFLFVLSFLMISCNKQEPIVDIPICHELVTPFFDYKIDLDKNVCNYDEEINATVYIFPGGFCPGTEIMEDGYFEIKIEESENYEIIGDKTASIPYKVDVFLKTGYKDPLTAQFTIKPKKISYLAEAINIFLKFDYKQEYHEKYFGVEKGAEFQETFKRWIDISNEYFYKIPDLYYVINENGLRCDVDDINVNRDVKVELMFTCLAEAYLSDYITKEQYFSYFIEFIQDDKPLTAVYPSDINGTDYYKVVYYSKNIRALFYLNSEKYEIVKDVPFSERSKIAKFVIDLLYEENKIDEETYLNELQYLSENGLIQRIWDYDLFKYVPFIDHTFSEKWYHYIIYKDK